MQLITIILLYRLADYIVKKLQLNKFTLLVKLVIVLILSNLQIPPTRSLVVKNCIKFAICLPYLFEFLTTWANTSKVKQFLNLIYKTFFANLYADLFTLLINPSLQNKEIILQNDCSQLYVMDRKNFDCFFSGSFILLATALCVIHFRVVKTVREIEEQRKNSLLRFIFEVVIATFFFLVIVGLQIKLDEEYSVTEESFFMSTGLLNAVLIGSLLGVYQT